MTGATSQTVFALVLAAGSSSRFGSTKQLAELDGVALVRRALDVAVECCGNNTILVVGHDWPAVSATCDANDGFMILNDRFADGLGSSIALAVRAVAHVASAIIVVLADQPRVSGPHLSALRDAWSGAPDEIVATKFATTAGPPVLFPQACFADLAALQGDSGARHLFDDRRFSLRTVSFEGAAIDVDTVADLESLRRN